MVGLRLLLLLLLLGVGGGTGDGARASEDTSFPTEAREWMDGAEIRTIQSMSLGARGDHQRAEFTHIRHRLREMMSSPHFPSNFVVLPALE